MINGIRLAPSLMCVNWLDVRSDITWIESAGIFDFMHIDIVDGKFAYDTITKTHHQWFWSRTRRKRPPRHFFFPGGLRCW